MRGRRDVVKTRSILLKILAGGSFKQIAFEEGIHMRRITWVKRNYIRKTVVLVLNARGLRIMEEGAGQKALPLVRKTDLRVDHRRK